ncbi:AmmeMemoRadiSam system protein B [Candidatus Woesearchaeota archaeon]|nr:AmmeMemoRadiSam system protein B [Candidatus Woesearchaeota archaeon]
MVRLPCVAGQFYEGEKEELLKQIRGCFLSELGPGKLPQKKKEGKTKAAIVPHAGYIFSGACAAHAYKRISESEQPDLFIIIGPNHTGFGRTSVLLDDFSTPLGTAKVDNEFGEALMREFKIDNDARVHRYEHSIEVQLPFLQFAVNKFKFLPIIISSPHYLDELAAAIKKTAKDLKRNICIIASSDFTHFGYNYGFIPFTENVKENISKLDAKAVELIKSFDDEGFLGYVRGTGATICGFLPIVLLMKIIKNEKPKSELLKYYTSADVMGDYSNSVSYASIVFS